MHRSLNVVVRDSLGRQMLGFNSEAMIERLRLKGIMSETINMSGSLQVELYVTEIATEGPWTKIKNLWSRVVRTLSRRKFPVDSHGVTFSRRARKQWLNRKFRSVQR